MRMVPPAAPCHGRILGGRSGPAWAVRAAPPPLPGPLRAWGRGGSGTFVFAPRPGCTVREAALCLGRERLRGGCRPDSRRARALRSPRREDDARDRADPLHGGANAPGPARAVPRHPPRPPVRRVGSGPPGELGLARPARPRARRGVRASLREGPRQPRGDRRHGAGRTGRRRRRAATAFPPGHARALPRNGRGRGVPALLPRREGALRLLALAGAGAAVVRRRGRRSWSFPRPVAVRTARCTPPRGMRASGPRSAQNPRSSGPSSSSVSSLRARIWGPCASIPRSAGCEARRDPGRGLPSGDLPATCRARGPVRGVRLSARA